MKSKKTTIFRQLIFNIIITLPVLFVFAGVNFQINSSIRVNGSDKKDTINSNEVTEILKFLDIASNSIDPEGMSRFNKLSSILTKENFTNAVYNVEADMREIPGEFTSADNPLVLV